jgi:hypothetical protein
MLWTWLLQQQWQEPPPPRPVLPPQLTSPCWPLQPEQQPLPLAQR